MKLYLFNPDSDLALANNETNYIAPVSARRMAQDLALLPVWYADPYNAVLAPSAYNADFLKQMRELFPLQVQLATEPELPDYADAFFASFLRLLKYGSFYLSIFLPGVFVCLAVYLPELLPPQLLFKIEAAERATPFPLFGEMVLVILLLEIIREAGLRMPQTLGHSVSLVAALIIGDAAIATGLLSTPVILIAAVASIAVFVVPSLYEMATAFRFLVLLAAGVAGPVGLVCAALVVLLALAQVSALGVPYCAPVRFPQTALSPDGVTRRTYRTLSAHPFSIWQKRR